MSPLLAISALPLLAAVLPCGVWSPPANSVLSPFLATAELIVQDQQCTSLCAPGPLANLLIIQPTAPQSSCAVTFTIDSIALQGVRGDTSAFSASWLLTAPDPNTELQLLGATNADADLPIGTGVTANCDENHQVVVNFSPCAFRLTIDCACPADDPVEGDGYQDAPAQFAPKEESPSEGWE